MYVELPLDKENIPEALPRTPNTAQLDKIIDSLIENQLLKNDFI